MRAIVSLPITLILAASLGASAIGAAPMATLVRDIRIGGGSDPRSLTQAAGRVFFTAADGIHGRELWVTDGTEGGTRLVRDIRQGPKGSFPEDLAKVGSRVFFRANDGIHGNELWVSDGTHAGTRLVKDLRAGPKGTLIDTIVDVAGTAFLTDHTHLWRSDGTASGTRRVGDFDGVELTHAQSLGPTLFFVAGDALWTTNGTTAGTKRLSPPYWAIDAMARFRGHIYYVAHPPLPPFGGVPELWWSDGTKAGTERFGTVRDPRHLAAMDGYLYFDGRPAATKSSRLYRGDGTVAGTKPVSPVTPKLGPKVREVGQFWSNQVGRRQGPQPEPDALWVSDGTHAGTTRVHGGDEEWANTGWDGLDAVGLEGLLWFAAGPGGPVGDDDWMLLDHEIWSSDGTEAGTMEAVDLNPDGSSFPSDFRRLGQTVTFVADDGEHGRELWSLTLP